MGSEVKGTDLVTIARDEPQTAAFFDDLRKMGFAERAATAEALAKAVIDSTTPATAAQQLNATQSTRYFREPRCGAATLSMADIIPINGPQADLDRIGYPPRRTMGIGPTETTSPLPAEENRPTFTQVPLVPKDYMYPAKVGRRMLATNLERAQLLDTVLDGAQMAVVSDCEEIIWQSVVGGTNPATWNSRGLTTINGLHQQATNCASVSAGAAQMTFTHLLQMKDQLPGQAQDQIDNQKEGYFASYDFTGDQDELGPWVYYMPHKLVNRLKNLIGPRVTEWGDHVYKEGGRMYFNGIPVIGTCGIPTNLVGTGGSSAHTDDDLTYCVLTQTRNVRFGYMTHPGEIEDQFGIAAWTHPHEWNLYQYVAILWTFDVVWALPSHVCFLTNVLNTL